MGYAFKKSQSVERNVQRIAREQVDLALATLHDESLPIATRIHQVRKVCKKVRGLLRLVRPALGADYETENAAFRDASAMLSGLRDADVVINSLDGLTARFEDIIDPAGLEHLRAMLQRLRDAARARVIDGQLSLRQFEDAMLAARTRIDAWVLNERGFRALETGLKKSYTQAFRSLKDIRTGPTVEELHDLRKHVKNGWYQTRLLQPIDKKALRRRSANLKRLGEMLGDDRDLAMLGQSIESIEHGADTESTRIAVRTLIQVRQAELRRDAIDLAQQLYKSNPKKWVGRLRTEWKDWR